MSLVTLDIAEAVGRITLNQPEQLNALSDAMQRPPVFIGQ